MSKESELNLEVLAAQLTNFGLHKFLLLVDYQAELWKRTINQRKLGEALQLSHDAIDIYMAAPVEVSRNREMYAHIIRVLEHSERDTENFLEALHESNNSHILKYIKQELDKLDQVRMAKSRSSSSAPSALHANAPSSMSTERKAEVVSRHLKTVELAKFLRPHLLYLCEKTKNLKAFTLILLQSKVISQIEKEECDRLIDFDKCTKLYEIAGKTGYGEKLIQALESSENEHIIEEMLKWIQ